jgi:GNAT superfamily N-acetyltransferase
MSPETALTWTHESPAHWDESKARIVGAAPPGIFTGFGSYRPGDLLPGEWWRVTDGNDNAVLGFGWLDCTWGDAEVALAVDPTRQHAGVGTFILDNLEREASRRGVNYMYNVVREGHPERKRVMAWLEQRRFAHSHDAQRLQRRVREA